MNLVLPIYIWPIYRLLKQALQGAQVAALASAFSASAAAAGAADAGGGAGGGVLARSGGRLRELERAAGEQAARARQKALFGRPGRTAPNSGAANSILIAGSGGARQVSQIGVKLAS